MAAPYVEQGFSKPDFLQKIFRLPVRHNAIIEINNLLARAAQVTDVTADDVRTVTDKYKTTLWNAPGWMDTRIGECSMKPEVRFGYREEAAEVLYA